MPKKKLTDQGLVPYDPERRGHDQVTVGKPPKQPHETDEDLVKGSDLPEKES